MKNYLRQSWTEYIGTSQKAGKISKILSQPLPPVLNVVWVHSQIVRVNAYAQKHNIDAGGGGRLRNFVDFLGELEFVPNILSKIVWDKICLKKSCLFPKKILFHRVPVCSDPLTLFLHILAFFGFFVFLVRGIKPNISVYTVYYIAYWYLKKELW